MTSGATEPPLSMMRGFRDLTGAEVVHAYGATDTTPMATVNRYKPSVRERLWEDELVELKRKQGFPVTGVDIRIVNGLGDDVPWDGSPQARSACVGRGSRPATTVFRQQTRPTASSR